MLLTAPTSTFAWWMAYLMQLQRRLPKENPVFYELCHEDCLHLTKKDYFPPNWLPMAFNKSGHMYIVNEVMGS
jgi:hypothetical protein